MNEPLVFAKQPSRTYKMGDVFVYDVLTFFKSADPENPDVDNRVPMKMPDYWKFNELIGKVFGDEFDFAMTEMNDSKLIFKGPSRHTRGGVISYVSSVRAVVYNHMTIGADPKPVYKEATPILKPSIASLKPIESLSD